MAPKRKTKADAPAAEPKAAKKAKTTEATETVEKAAVAATTTGGKRSIVIEAW